MTRFASASLSRAATTALFLALGSMCVPMGVRHALAQQPVQGGALHAGWSIPFAGTASSPIVAGDSLFLGSADGALYAIDTRNGSTRWRFQTGVGLTSGPQIVQVPQGASVAAKPASGPQWPAVSRREIAATPIVDTSTVYVGSRDFSFYAIDALSGQRKWAYATGGPIFKEARIHANVVIVVSDDGLLYGLDAQTGEKRWEVDTVPVSNKTGKRPPTLPIIQDGTVYVTNWPVHRVPTPRVSFIHAIDPSSGRVKWTNEVEGNHPTSPIYAEGLIVFSTTEDTLSRKSEDSTAVAFYAIDAASGRVKWRHETEGRGSERAALRLDGRIVIGTDRRVSALDPQTGAVRWTRTSDAGDVFTHPAGHGGTVLVGTSQWARMKGRGELLALDVSTGTLRWSSRLGSRFGGRDGGIWVAAAKGDSVYVVAGKHLQRLQLETGKELWSHEADTWIHARPWVGDASVYVAATEVTYFGQATVPGRLQALDVRTGRIKP